MLGYVFVRGELERVRKGFSLAMKSKPANYVVSIPDGTSWVHIEVHGSISADLLRMMLLESIDLAHRHHLCDFFYDGSDSENGVSILKQYQFVHQDLEEYGFDQRSKMAMLINAEDSSRDFIETVLRNEGYNFRLFTDRTEATSWLQRREPQWA